MKQEETYKLVGLAQEGEQARRTLVLHSLDALREMLEEHDMIESKVCQLVALRAVADVAVRERSSTASALFVQLVVTAYRSWSSEPSLRGDA